MSEDQPAAPKPARRRRGRKFLIVLAVLLLAFAIFRGVVAYRAHTALAAFRAAGYPTSLKELAQYYPEPPPGQNGAVLLMRAFDLLKLPEDRETEPDLPLYGRAELPPPGQPLPPAMVQAIERLLAQNQEALDLIHRAAGMQRLRYPLNLQLLPADVTEQMIHIFAPLRRSARLVEMEYLLALEKGETDQALDHIETTLGLARSLDGCPFLISYLVRAAVEALATDEMSRLFSSTGLSELQLARVRAMITTIDSTALARAARDEGAYILAPLTDPEFLDSEWFGESRRSMKWGWRLFRLTGLPALDQAYLARKMGVVVALAASPASHRLQSAKREMEDAAPWWCVLTRLGFSSSWTTTVFEADARATAMRQAALLAVAIEEHKLEAGAWPRALSDLVPAALPDLPIDPFDGQPLRYKVIEGGYAIWSVGADRVDNGGTDRADLPPIPKSLSRFRTCEDIVFRVQRPAPTTALSP